ncbi:MAG: GNAT family N-acetyltransferase [Nocardioidaceae bacterium]|nr:MAG: GNAT family N-acetyltransferase [Nocardioidaceae bacterium]
MTIRAITDDEILAWRGVPHRAYHASRVLDPADLDFLRGRYQAQTLTGVFDGDEIVATARTWDCDLPTPGGGTVKADALSSVAVAAGHRRRGILTALMRHCLDDARARGCALSVLIASEAGIYERFGYGPASEHCTWVLDAQHAQFRDSSLAAAYDIELCQDRDLRDIAPAIQAEAAALLPGAMPRTGSDWDLLLGLAGMSDQDTTKVRNAVVLGRAGRPRAYARYHIEEKWEERLPRSTLHVDDLAATDPESYAAVWQFLASIDLVATVRAGDRPVDEPLPWLLADPRAARQLERSDFEWVCVLDPVAALAGRSYATEDSLVLRAGDGPGIRIRVSAGTPQVEQTDVQPDLVMAQHTLGSIYLGQQSLVRLQSAGLLTENTPGAVRRAAAMFEHTPSAWSGHTWF